MNWKIQINVLILSFAILTGCEPTVVNQQQELRDKTQPQVASEIDVQTFVNSLKISYTVVDNITAEGCKDLVESGLCFDAEISLSLEDAVNLKNWKIFFSNMSPILLDSSELFDITHVNGDQHFISPTESFKGWTGQQSATIGFKAEFWHISEFDSPPNFYLVVEGHEPQIIKSTTRYIDSETGQETLPHMASFKDSEKQFKRGKIDLSVWDTAKNLYQVNQKNGVTKINANHRVIPKPLKQTVLNPNEYLDLSSGLLINKNEFNIGLDNPAIIRLNRLGLTVSQSKGVAVEITKLTLNELSDSDRLLLTASEYENKNYSSQILESAYLLEVSKQGISIKAGSEKGIFYGLQSIAGLYQPGFNQLSLVRIVDKPRYQYRGFFIDVSRNFRNADFIINLLDQMAAYKLNKFHFHLGDDEGWRLEIPGLPELTELGSKRCHDPAETTCLSPQLGNGPVSNTDNNGFYSLQDYQRILKAASARHIEVIPSFDMPGHSRAAVKSMQLRYKKLLVSGDRELAEEYLLTDQNDQSIYSSVQFYNDNTLNVCKESTYRFVEKVLAEVIELHKSAEQPLRTYHIGADETAGAWNDSPDCQQFMNDNMLTTEQLTPYFIQRVAKFLASKNVRPGGWSDGLGLASHDEMPSDVHVNVWTPLFWEGHKVAHSMVNRDWQVVLSMPDVSYFDFPYQADPKERGYYWGSRNTNTRQIFEWMPDNLPIHAEIWRDRQNIPFVSDDREIVSNDKSSGYQPKKVGKSFYGIQAQLWSEMVRSDDIAEYLIFPRLLALAERAWHKPSWEVNYDYRGALFSSDTNSFTESLAITRNRDWLEFSNAIAAKEMSKLDRTNTFYRLPTAGAILIDNKLFMNSAFPGLPLQYKIGSDEWINYSNQAIGVDVPPDELILVRTTNYSGTRVGRFLTVNNMPKRQ